MSGLFDTPDPGGRQPNRETGVPVSGMKAIGYRSWRLGWNGQLHSHGAGEFTWEKGENTADCRLGFPHAAPDPDCDCGLYANHHLDGAERGLDRIRGVIVASGNLQVHRDGFRAERAEIVALEQTADADARRRQTEQQAASRYGVQLVPADMLEQVAFEHGDQIAPELIEKLIPRPIQTRAYGQQRARTRREVQLDHAYEKLATPIRQVPALRTALLCVQAYGSGFALWLWAVLLVSWVRHPPAALARICGTTRNQGCSLQAIVHHNTVAHAGQPVTFWTWMAAFVVPFVPAFVPAVAASVIGRARAISPSDPGAVPAIARLGPVPFLAAATLAVLVLPSHWPAVTATVGIVLLTGLLLAIGSVLVFLTRVRVIPITITITTVIVIAVLAAHHQPIATIAAITGLGALVMLIYDRSQPAGGSA